VNKHLMKKVCDHPLFTNIIHWQLRLFINLPIIYLIFKFNLLVNPWELFSHCFRNKIDNRNGDLSSSSLFKRNREKEEINKKLLYYLPVVIFYVYQSIQIFADMPLYIINKEVTITRMTLIGFSSTRFIQNNNRFDSIRANL